MKRWARRGSVLVLAAIFFGVYAFWRFQGGFVSGFLFYTVAGLVFYELYAFFLALRGVQAIRLLPARQRISGDSLEVILQIRRPFPVPLIWLRVEDVLPARLGMHCRCNGPVMLPWFQHAFKVTYKLDALPRGAHRFEQIELSAGDPFGLVTVSKHVRQPDELLVYPRYQTIRDWPMPDLPNLNGNTSRRRQTEDSAEVSGLRDFAPGDRLQRIHWKATARNMTLKSKEFEFQAFRNYLFFLDLQRQSYKHGQFGDPLLEKAVSLTLSLATYTISRRFPTGLTAQADKPVRIAPAGSQGQLSALYDQLARVEASGDLPLESLFEREGAYVKERGMQVFVTSRLREPLVQMLRKACLGQQQVALFWLTETRPTEVQQGWIRQLNEVGASVYPVIDNDFQSVVREGRHVS